MSEVTVTPQSIQLHSEQSNYYKWRTPYVPKLFQDVCAELNISKNARLMDLGCGTGEVATHLSKFASKVYAIDGSKEMIAQAKPIDNVEYQVVDLNNSDPVNIETVQHMFFGRCIHWFPESTLRRLSEACMHPNGKIVVCSTQWSPVGDWGEDYLRIKQKFSPFKQSLDRKLDHSGQSNLGDAGFRPLKKYTAPANLHVNAKFMVNHAMSTSYGENLIHLKNKFSEFEQEVTQHLLKFEQENKIVMGVKSWAIIYGR
jgi:SAM-dependent methyltransferase